MVCAVIGFSAVIVGWQFSANNLPDLIKRTSHVEGKNEGGATESGDGDDGSAGGDQASGGEEGDGNGDTSDEGDSDESADGDIGPEETASGDQESEASDGE